jgi:outer membrane protein OmpA-like peptidoglycan-associated protein
MRILITGFVVFVIWCFFSVWLFTTRLLPAINKPVTIQTIPESPTSMADTVSVPGVSEPEDILIFFDFDETEFIRNSIFSTRISELKDWLDRDSVSRISVTGHTDNIGTGEYNITLGLKRAVSVRKYLEEEGIISSRMDIESGGEDQPSSDNDTEEGRAENRRVVISVQQ